MITCFGKKINLLIKNPKQGTAIKVLTIIDFDVLYFGPQNMEFPPEGLLAL